jgi:hypothetical protein
MEEDAPIAEITGEPAQCKEVIRVARHRHARRRQEERQEKEQEPTFLHWFSYVRFFFDCKQVLLAKIAWVVHPIL